MGDHELRALDLPPMTSNGSSRCAITMAYRAGTGSNPNPGLGFVLLPAGGDRQTNRR